LPCFRLFGITLQSDWNIAARESSGQLDLQLIKGNEAFFSSLPVPETTSSAPFSYKRLPDESLYLHWRDQFEFHISPDSRTIHGRAFDGVPEESLQVYLLGQVLSFALIGLGIEPLHATTLVIDGSGVAIIGDSGYGKSSLAGAFVHAGHKLLSDDLLVLERSENGFVAFPGLPRLKLYDVMASRFITDKRGGVPMNQDHSPKRIYPMEHEWHDQPVPMKAFYSLVPPREAANLLDVRIDPLTEREAFIELTKNSFNVAMREIGRLQKHLDWAAEVARTVPVRRLSYPRKVEMFDRAISAVMDDLAKL
jgi:hypothetical protein